MGKYLSLDGDITFLEIIPIALSIFLWHKLFCKKKIRMHGLLAMYECEKLNYHIMIAIVAKLSLKKMHLHLTF
jgi:hypothetical protein